jgi:hypothetical protein
MAYGNKSNIPSAPYPALTGVTSTAGELNYSDITAAGTVEATKAVVVDGSKDIGTFGDVAAGSLTVTAVARTATATGATTGTIAALGSFQRIAVTSTSANDIIILPPAVVGTVIELHGGASGYELRSSAPGSIEIGNGTVNAAAESAIPALSVVHITCVTTTLWVGWMVVDSTLAAIPGAAA